MFKTNRCQHTCTCWWHQVHSIHAWCTAQKIRVMSKLSDQMNTLWLVPMHLCMQVCQTVSQAQHLKSTDAVTPRLFTNKHMRTKRVCERSHLMMLSRMHNCRIWCSPRHERVQVSACRQHSMHAAASCHDCSNGCIASAQLPTWRSHCHKDSGNRCSLWPTGLHIDMSDT